MEFDYQSIVGGAELAVYPSWGFGSLPLQPNQIKEGTVIAGSQVNTSSNIEGSVVSAVLPQNAIFTPGVEG